MSRPVRLLMAAAPDGPGAAASWQRAVERARAGSDAGILLTGSGLGWAARTDAIAEAHAAGVSLALCSRSARDRKVDPLSLPPSVRWSSLTTWIADAPSLADHWCVFP
jgi:hypothetical protein